MAVATTEHLLSTLAEAKGEKVDRQSAILDAVREWRGMGENLLESLGNWVSDIEAREKSLRLVTEFLEKGLNDLEKRERDFDLRKGEMASKEGELGPLLKEVELREEILDEQLKLVNEHIQSLEEAQNEVQRLKLLECEKLKEIERKQREVGLMEQSLEKRLSVVERREKEVESFTDKKLRELVLKEEDLGRKREEFVNEVELVDEKLREREKLGHGLTEKLDAALDKLEGMEVSIDERFKEIKSWETAANKSLLAIADEADSVREQLEKRIEEFETMERGLNASLEDKVQNSGLKDQHPSVIREELLKEVKLVDEKLSGQQELGRRLLERLEEVMARKLNEVESLQPTLNVTTETVDAKDSDLIREQKNVWLQEREKREEFHFYQEKKERELELEGKKLGLIVEELIQEVKCREEKFDEQCPLLVRLELVQSNLKNMNSGERFKAMSSKQSGLNCCRDCTEKKVNELESKAGNTGNREKGVKANENGVGSKENRLENHTLRLAGKDQQPEWEVRKLELNGGPTDVHLNESELKHRQLTGPLDTHFCIEPMGSVGLKRTFDLGRLEIVIKNTKKDMELMADRVSEVLLESSNPAMLVLDAMAWFHTPHLGNGDVESNMRRIRILLLDQLTKRSAEIHPCLRAAAVKLANEWKSKIRAVDENPLQVSEFLHLLAAYNLPSSFDKDELLGLMKTVAQHKQTPGLCRILDLTDKVEGFVQDLINEKQYLLASTYIHECKLEKIFRQASVLDYYVKHVKMLAQSKYRREHYSIETKAKAIADEIADLRVAIQHIVKHNLESEYSPDILMGRIKQLESELASLKSDPPADLHEQEIGKRSKRKAQHIEDWTAIEAMRTQLPERCPEVRTPPHGWRGRRKTKKHCAPFHEPWLQIEYEASPFHQIAVVDEWPMRRGSGSHKRHRTNFRDFCPKHKGSWR